MELLKSHQCLCFKSFLNLWKTFFPPGPTQQVFERSKPNSIVLRKLLSFPVQFSSLLLRKQCISLQGNSGEEKKIWNTFVLHAMFCLWMSIYFSISYLTFLLLFLTFSSTDCVYLNQFVYSCKVFPPGWFTPFSSHAKSTRNKSLGSKFWFYSIN